MSYLFFEDFSFHDEMRGAYNIAIERNSDLEHGHATVADDAYHILVCGNKHFAKTPAITNFDLKLDLNIKTSQFEVEDSYRTYGFRIFFRYDRFRGKGYLLEGGATVKKITVKLIAIDNSHQREILQELEAPTPDDFNPTAFKVGVEARKNIFNLKLDDLFLSFTDDNCLFSEGGSIGLDKTYYPGELIVEKFLIESDGDFERSRIIPPLTVELPCIQGMSVPYKYTLNLSKFENGPYELAVKLEGGIKDRPDRGKPAGQWVHEIDRMRDPYIRVESPCGEIANILLFNGLKTLLDREEERPWVVDQYPQPQWPLERTIYFDKLPNPEELFFAVGYEYFFNDPKRFLAGGPFEALCDSVGETLWVGKSLRRGDVVVSVKSPKGKRLVSMIPHDVPDYEKAVIHAENNNYFVDDEKITFKIDILYRSKLNFSGEFNLNVELRSVFGEKLANEVKVVAIEENSAAPVLKDKLGMESSSFDVLLEGTLDTGVYHLNVVCERGGERIHDEDVVFEVMSTAPDAVSPPLASGLPLLFSIPNETKYLHTDAFDPLYPATGAAHYFGMSSFASIYGREKRIWELLSLYKRKWFVAIDRRTAFDDSIEGNQDVLKHCDYTGVPLENKPRHGRYELWKEDIYTGDILNTLIEFFTGNPDFLDEFDELSMEKLEELRKENGTLPQKAFVELVDICWSEWLEFFSAYYAGVLSRHFEKLKSINKDIRTTTGGPFSLYAAHNKSAYFLKLFGHDVRGKTRNFYNGFWQFEDYAHSCGYSFTKAPFAMMTIKLHYENWNIFPEIYSTMLLDGCNDGAVSQAHPPFGFYQMPVALMRERIYEYAFATTWFKEGEFRYWKDNGFHLRNPKKEYVAELLRAWGNTRKHRPVKPVRTSCFLADVDLIAMHPDHYEANCNVHAPWKDVVNTAEEATVYTYEAARSAGIPAGFATRLDELDSIDPKMTDL
ncbi:MAG: hypothetical protein KAG97_02650, partial [Victivallales bacterium]|nr:hypothetical protein [Victivallales bacterium]